MTYLIKFIVCFAAGIGAGLGTGFAGMSAAAVISPCSSRFWAWTPTWPWASRWQSDVLASAISAYTYGKTETWTLKTAPS